MKIFTKTIFLKKKCELLCSIFLILTITLLFPSKLFAEGHPINICIRNNTDNTVKHGVNVLISELKKRHYSPVILMRKYFHHIKGTSIYIGNISNYANNETARRLNINVPMPKNSYVVRVIKGNIYIYGSDDVGTMYGAYDVTEQLEWADTPIPITDVLKNKTETPYLRYRGLNMFLQTQPLADTGSWFFNLDYWRKYLDQLSFNRFNFLDLHGVYDIYNTDFYNLFAYFIKPAGFKDVGLPQRDCTRNLNMLKKIIQMAKVRGIRIGIMTYNMDSFVGGQPRPGRSRNDPKITLKKLKGDRLVSYLRDATSAFLKAVPNLWVFGFRMGESGKRLDFFNDTFVKGVQKSGREGMPIYTRSWLTTRRVVDNLAKHYPGPLFVEIKYNGEQAGPPYQAITGTHPYHLSYSYEEYSDRPQDFKIIWQIRFNGSDRIFRWGDPAYVKRAVQTLHFANGKGLSIEPIQTYFPHTDFFNNAEFAAHDYFKWGFQRDWLWYILWGRLSYNPNTNSRAWMYKANKKFGSKAAKNVIDILSTSSKVIPFIVQTHLIGPDHREMAPEYETGNGIDYHFKPSEKGYDKGINGFINVTPMDNESYMSVKDYVDEQIAGKYSGRHTPIEVSNRFKKIARHIFDLIHETDPMIKNNQEYKSIRMDAEALAQLALYYSEKMLAAVDLETYYRTYDFSKIQPALKHDKNAYAHWQKLSQITAKHFRPFPAELRMRTNTYTWKSQLPYLKEGIETIEQQRSELKHLLTNYTGLKIAYAPVRKFRLHENINIAATLLYHKTNSDSQPHMQLFYRKLGQKDFQEQQMFPADDGLSFNSIIPKKWTSKSDRIEYYIQASFAGMKAVWPENGEKSPAIINVTDDNQPPVIKYEMKQSEIPAHEFIIKARISDPSGVKSARVFYKLQPSYLNWTSKKMTNIDDNEYQVILPLSARGLMFHFEAIDNHGNGTIYPNPNLATPYYVIEAWDKSKAK